VQLKDISKAYGNKGYKALNNVTLSFDQGQFASIMGPSGCGKSTLLNLIAGIDQPSSGQLLFEGKDLFAMNDEDRTRLRAAKIGFVFQFFNLLSTLTVRENVMLPLELQGVRSGSEARKMTDALLHQVGLNERANSYPSELSGGEMQRTAIARALVHSPTVILADEPTGNLDTENGEAVLNLLRTANSDMGVTIIMATHSAEAASYASYNVRMRDGAVVD